MQASYIKNNEPLTYQFFMEYWEFSKKYWHVVMDEDWWNCFLADLEYLVSKYDNNDFFVALLMQMYIRNRQPDAKTDSIDNLKAFYKEWWSYINKFYRTDPNTDWWEEFMQETKDMFDKYKRSEFFSEIINVFVKYKTA